MNEMQPTRPSTNWAVAILGVLGGLAILVVLAAFLIGLPVLQRFREADRRRAAAMNLKQIESALRNYEQAMLPKIQSKSGKDVGTVDAVRELVSKQLGVAIEAIEPNATLASLGADQLDVVELIMAIESQFDIELSDSAIVATDGKPLELPQFVDLTVQRLVDIVDRSRSGGN